MLSHIVPNRWNIKNFFYLCFTMIRGYVAKIWCTKGMNKKTLCWWWSCLLFWISSERWREKFIIPFSIRKKRSQSISCFVYKIDFPCLYVIVSISNVSHYIKHFFLLFIKLHCLFAVSIDSTRPILVRLTYFWPKLIHSSLEQVHYNVSQCNLFNFVGCVILEFKQTTHLCFSYWKNNIKNYSQL